LDIKRVLGDEAGQILGLVIKIGLVVIVVALVIAEVAPLIWLRFSTIQDAEDVVGAVAQEYAFYHDQAKAVETAGSKLSMMGYSEEEVKESVVEFLPAGAAEKQSVKVTVVKYANTLVTRHISFLKKFARVATTKESGLGTTR